MLFRRPRSYPAAMRERARELRRAGFTYSEIIAELGGGIPQATLQDVCIVRYHSLAIRRFLDALTQGVVDDLLENE